MTSVAAERVGQLDPQSLVAQSVGVLIGCPPLIAGKLPGTFGKIEDCTAKVVAEMPFRRWTFQLDGVPHTVELEHGFVSGKRVIRIDGRTIESTGWMWKIDMGSRHAFQVGSHACELKIGRMWELGIGYMLHVDGQVVKSESSRRSVEE